MPNWAGLHTLSHQPWSLPLPSLSPSQSPHNRYSDHIHTYHDELRLVFQAMYVLRFLLKSQHLPNLRLSSHRQYLADQSALSHIPPILANSPSNAFHSTASTAFQPQPAYDQMAAAAAAVANGQDYYQHQHQHQQPMIYMPPVSHNPPPNPVQPTAMDHTQAQPTAPVAGASPQSQSVSPGREASSTPTARTLNSSKRAEQNRKAQRAFRERRDVYVIPSHSPPLQIPTITVTYPFAIVY
jgi:hypothetical protein